MRLTVPLRGSEGTPSGRPSSFGGDDNESRGSSRHTQTKIKDFFSSPPFSFVCTSSSSLTFVCVFFDPCKRTVRDAGGSFFSLASPPALSRPPNLPSLTLLPLLPSVVALSSSLLFLLFFLSSSV
ncbi:putative transmembrane protein [Toxoplasma gondii GT1]|uniref:Transmembrane protein n=5 Tax=Toxoplasma gondii TaxID=5811 RepID=B9QLB6_TOXGV|nr:putative transmembrane protein [Toxoplasma gondii GT1]ESS29292.1 putative transmembrane protein [Toxoplasma gondii VEG]KFG35610.1 putative transmembrane protein [Toxoplasma gondii p89]KFH14345.1 putative transmembrane protein [Toxoplasma gondii MAS]PIL97754.1 putative transmembrane protein [Toxoplasma gondii COUG]